MSDRQLDFAFCRDIYAGAAEFGDFGANLDETPPFREIDLKLGTGRIPDDYCLFNMTLLLRLSMWRDSLWSEWAAKYGEDAMPCVHRHDRAVLVGCRDATNEIHCIRADLADAFFAYTFSMAMIDRVKRRFDVPMPGQTTIPLVPDGRPTHFTIIGVCSNLARVAAVPTTGLNDVNEISYHLPFNTIRYDADAKHLAAAESLFHDQQPVYEGGIVIPGG